MRDRTIAVAAMILAARLNGNTNIVGNRKELIDDSVRLAIELSRAANIADEKEATDGL